MKRAVIGPILLVAGLVGCAGKAEVSGHALDYACADAGACNSTPADVACTVDADCTILVAPNCGSAFELGVNAQSHLACSAPPCAVSQNDPGTYTFQAQDCSHASSANALVVHCVDRQCLTSFN